MKIAFIVRNLEPGRDGVGDYTRRLAGELIRQGHGVRIISLNDKVENGKQKAEIGNDDRISAFSFHLSAFLEIQNSDGTDVECLRLPRTMRWPQRVELARQWLDEFNSDWLSLQFVPFGFHPKGLCFGLGKRLAAINSKAQWHIMFHELWLGLAEHSTVKHRLWGALQRCIVRDLIRRLRPRVVHTHAEPYRIVLDREGIKAVILPLFSNISVVSGNAWTDLIAPLLAEREAGSGERNQFYLAGVFGAVHPEWDAEVAVVTLLPLVRRFQKRLVLVFFGKSNLYPERLGRLKSQLENRAGVVMAGERPANEISLIMRTMDLGLATSPRQMIQKSASVAAMLEHGLPVLVIRDDWHLRGLDSPLGNISSRLLTPEQFAALDILPTRDPQWTAENGVKQVAGQMLGAISQY